MKSIKKAIALLLAAVMCTALFAGCGKSADTALVVGYSGLSGKLSPFFYDSFEEQNVCDITSLNLLNYDRAGNVVEKGIDGVTSAFNGTDYTYYGPADLNITKNSDGTVDYNFNLRENLVFSDGEPLTIDDVIFTMYTYSDPTYDGMSTFSSLPIKGLDAYRAGWATLNNLIFAAGQKNADFTVWTQETQNEFWAKYDAAALGLAYEIVDYCVENGEVEEGDVAAAAKLWDFDLAAGATVNTFAAALSEAYGQDVAAMINNESVVSSVDDLFPGYDTFAETAIQTGDSVDSIEGIVRTGDFSMTVTMTEFNATAVEEFVIPIAPLHYYGDPAKYDYANNKFGFDKCDLSVARDKNSKPLGAGPYKFDRFENGSVYFTANENYYRGKPETGILQFKQYLTDDEKLNSVVTGDADVVFDIESIETIKQIELSGDKLATKAFDQLGYGYIGMCANIMNVGGDPASDASKALRKAFATLFSVYREAAVESFFGSTASVINYPVSNTSRCAPLPTDEGYETAFSVDKNGKSIYTTEMSAEDKYAAAKQAALGFLEAAGYTVEAGKVTAAPAGAALEYAVWIPGNGVNDHPAFAIMNEAQKAFGEIGITLNIVDVTSPVELWAAIGNQEVAIWCATWHSAVEPDMYALYFSGDDINQAGEYNYYYCINDAELNKLILDAIASEDQASRNDIYRSAFDIILDWAVEVPFYQRQDVVIFNSERVDASTVPDVTAFYGLLNEIQNVSTN